MEKRIKSTVGAWRRMRERKKGYISVNDFN
jgi:hypothetical protein